jgi:hypothetical protein
MRYLLSTVFLISAIHQSGMAQSGPPVPAIAPDSIPTAIRQEIGDTTKWLINHPVLGGLYPRNFVSIVFATGATQSSRQIAIEAIKGQVVGGTRIGRDGVYLVRIPDEGTATPLVNALALLDTLEQVAAASGVALGMGPIPIVFGNHSIVPSRPPDSVPAWTRADSSIDDNGYTKRVIGVLFREGTSQPERQAAIDLVRGTAISGLPFSTGDGFYIVEIQDDRSGEQLIEAIRRLRQLPQVEDASREFRMTSPSRSSERAATGLGSRVPGHPPDSVPIALWDSLHLQSNMEMNPARWGIPEPFPRNLIQIRFKDFTPQIERQYAIDLIRGRVIGGLLISEAGDYFVTIQDDGTSAPLMAAVAKLEALPQIETARPHFNLPIGPN